MKIKKLIILFIVILLSETSYSQSCIYCNNATYVPTASAAGFNANANAAQSWALGQSTSTQGIGSFAIGAVSEANGNLSFVYGLNLRASAPNSLVFGSGYNSSFKLENIYEKSLMIGCYSTKPSIFINYGDQNLPGKVGIGTTNTTSFLTVEGMIETKTGLGGTGGIKFPDGTIQSTAAVTPSPCPWITTPNSIYYTNGSVGINTTQPSANLEVNGTIKVTNNISAYSLEIWSGASKTLKIYPNGEIWSQAIWVQPSPPWPDFVFSKTYKLMPLKELETYILTNQHLPGLPSATVAEQQPINLLNQNQLLLQKIEELTLYILEQNKRIELLEKRFVR